MARIRSVKPEICISETMAGLTADLERTFVRLWTHCDDEGRCRDNTRLIKAAIYPLHDEITADVLDAQLDALVDAGVVIRYEVDGVPVVAVTNFSEHQKPQRPQKSKLPAPPADPDVAPAEHDAAGTSTRGVRDNARTSTRQRADVSRPVVVEVEGEGEGENTRAAPSNATRAPLPLPGSPPPATAPASKPSIQDEWVEFWQVYPRKVGKKAARAAWDRARKKKPPAEIHAALQACLPAWSTMDPQYIPHPTTWLNEGRYDDPPPIPRTTGTSRSVDNRTKIAASIARLEGTA